MAQIISKALRLPDGEFFPATQKKTGIAIHHTVGGSAKSTFDWWLKDRTKNGRPRLVGTAYIIDRDGTIYEIFDPHCWAYQFGLNWSPARNIKFEQRFIGIELASEGALLESDGKLYCFDRVSQKTETPREEVLDYRKDYRGYRYFDRYEKAQLDSLTELVDNLCHAFGILRRVPQHPFEYYGEALEDFLGIIGHAMVNADKTDPAPDSWLWERLRGQCDLREVSLTPAPAKRRHAMSQHEIDALFDFNMGQIDRLAVAVGSVVKGLIIELERRGTYIRLLDPVNDGHKIAYSFVKGSRGLVATIGRALGLERVTDTVLEVSDG